MKEKILNTVYKKLCEAFDTDFYTRKEFEKKLSDEYNSILESLAQITKAYFELKQAGDKEIVKMTKDEYIVKQFNADRRSWNKPRIYTFEDLEELKNEQNYSHNHYTKQSDTYFNIYSDAYEHRYVDGDKNIVITFKEYVISKLSQSLKEGNQSSELSVKEIFWHYLIDSYLQRYSIEQIEKTPEKVIEAFKEWYLSDKYLQLHDIAEKYINDVSFSGFEQYIINVGTRNHESNRSGWATNSFEVLNNGKEYSFTTSTKDEKLIKGEFINIFILQLNKKHLLKISITLDEVDQTTYIIWKEFEKISVKNEFEIHIAKHHGNETIIFDTRKQALEFQEKIIEIKEAGPPRKR